MKIFFRNYNLNLNLNIVDWDVVLNIILIVLNFVDYPQFNFFINPLSNIVNLVIYLKLLQYILGCQYFIQRNLANVNVFISNLIYYIVLILIEVYMLNIFYKLPFYA